MILTLSENFDFTQYQYSFLHRQINVKEPSDNWSMHTSQDINNNAWVTVNNDFLGHEWGDLPMIFTRDEIKGENHWQIAPRVAQQSWFTVTNVFFLFLTRYFISWIHNLAKNNYRSLISPLSLNTIFSDLILWPQLICDVMRPWGTGIVTSHPSIILARANWHKGDLH